MHCHAKATASKISKNPISHKTPSQQIELIYWPRSHITGVEKFYKKVFILNFPPFFPARSALLKSKQTVKKLRNRKIPHFSQDSAAKEAHENASITEAEKVKNPAEPEDHQQEEVSVTIIPPEVPATQNPTTSETRAANEGNVTVKPIKSQAKVQVNHSNMRLISIHFKHMWTLE